MARMTTVGHFNQAWTVFSRQFPPGSKVDTSKINPAFLKLAPLFEQSFRQHGLARIDAIHQWLPLPEALAQAGDQWLEAAEAATKRRFL